MKKTMICLSLALVLAGCSVLPGGKPKEALICPVTGLIADADSIAVPADAAALMMPGNITVNAIFGRYRGGCEKNRKGGIDFRLELDIMASKTDIGKDLKIQELPYFIAVLDASENIIQRDAFVTRITFNETGKALNIDKHVVHVPAGDPAASAQYRIVMGFILTPAQLDYNREAAANLKTGKTGHRNVR